LKPFWSMPLALALACNGATPRPGSDALPATCADQARTLAWANEGLALRSDELALDHLTRVLACEGLSDAHREIAEAGRDLLVATGPEVPRLRAYIKARKDSPAALAVALARLQALPPARAHAETLTLCDALAELPALRVSCFEAVGSLTEAEVGGALQAYGALTVLTAADLERILLLGTGETTKPLRACMTGGEPLVRGEDSETLGALAFKLSEVARPEPAACLRRLAFEHCREALHSGGVCPAPESIAPAIRDAAAKGFAAFVALHRRAGTLEPAINLWTTCEGTDNLDSKRRTALRMMHIAEAEALTPVLQRELREAASEAHGGLFNRVHHVDCARTLWCRDAGCDSTGLSDYFSFRVADGECPKSCKYPETISVREIGEYSRKIGDINTDTGGTSPDLPVEPVKPPDTDGDGIIDELDLCPDDSVAIRAQGCRTGCPATDDDRDGDGIRGAADECPNKCEIFNKIMDADGCADSPDDPDGDGIPNDLCPHERETFNRIMDADGCADSPNDPDGDGIPTYSVARTPLDLCPDKRETFNRIMDADGCPDSSNDADGDGILTYIARTAHDQCPDNRETFNRIMDEDGCPDSANDHDGDGVPNNRDLCPTRRETSVIHHLADGCPDPPNNCNPLPGGLRPKGCS